MYLIVGGGRMASHTRKYFDLLGIPYRSWRRSDRTPLEQAVDGATVALILISDDAIESFVAARTCLAPLRVVHFSGALHTPLAQACHPLATFGPDLYDLETYRDIAFVCDPEPASFGELFPELPNPAFVLEPELRPRYHALAVMAGNFTVMLWEKFYSELERMGIPYDAARPYIDLVARNLIKRSSGSLTGPLARGDVATVRANLDSLRDDAYEDVYRAFARVARVRLEEEE